MMDARHTTTTEGEEMPHWTNTSDEWGGPVEVTVEDYEAMAREFGIDPTIEERDDGIYIDGEQVADAIQ